VLIRKLVFSASILFFAAADAWGQPAPSINPGGVVNAASDAPDAPVAPGSIASVYGSFPVSGPVHAATVPLPLNLSGLTMDFGGTSAPLFFVSAGQVNIQVPWELAGQSQASLSSTAGTQKSASQVVNLAAFSPGIFSTNAQGSGQGAILDSSYRLVDNSNPATPGSTYILIYCTGLGAVTNQPPTGSAPGSGVPAQTTTTPTVMIGGVPATVSFSGLAPGFVGAYQVNALVPAAAATGNAVPVVIEIGGVVSNTVTIAVAAGETNHAIVNPAGGSTLNQTFIPLLFTWNTPLNIQGTGWAHGETVQVSLHGPLNWPPAATSDVLLGSLTVDQSGAISGSLTIPYDRGIVGPSARIPKPGTYEVVASGAVSGTTTGNATITICVATELGTGFQINWGTARGGRLGVFPGPLADYSPERVDPEWITVWRNAPVTAYGTIVPQGSSGGSQPAFVTYTDYPGTHYGHDANFLLTPDSEYQWLVGTANFYSDAPPQGPVAPGIIKIEWETLNGGNTSTYGQGNIGLPVWANPTVGDRVFVAGSWILDAGHPDTGDSTEIHPPRLMAAIRTRPAAFPGTGARASHVDVYVSGHGGGANQIDPPGLSELLDLGGWGGGRIEDVLSPSDQQTYYRAGPAPSTLATIVSGLVAQLAGEPLTDAIFATAGPSAFSWGAPGPEEHAINDMDYDFDVPLPPPPAGATSVQMQVVTHPEHTTAVKEVVTYGYPVNGLPTVAHVHLPYLGADNGIYARTLLFSWDQFASPGTHFHVQITGIQVSDTSGTWHMWSDVGGQWAYLSGLAAALLNNQNGQNISIPGAVYDVYLQSTDQIRVYVEGYRAECLDSLFGMLFGQSSYNAGLTLITKCGLRDNTDLGGALLTLPPVPSSAGQYTVKAVDSSSPPQSHFTVRVTVDYMP
jgi:uncharacterized protein (TIGR03437 family)